MKNEISSRSEIVAAVAFAWEAKPLRRPSLLVVVVGIILLTIHASFTWIVCSILLR